MWWPRSMRDQDDADQRTLDVIWSNEEWERYLDKQSALPSKYVNPADANRTWPQRRGDAMQSEPNEITLTFKVPTEFDAMTTEVAGKWVYKQLRAMPTYGDDVLSAQTAYSLMQLIHNRYMDAIGHPEWRLPDLP